MTTNKNSKQTENSPSLPTVVRAAKCGDGKKFYEIEKDDARAWISGARFEGGENAVFRELAEVGIEFFTPQSKNQLRNELQAYNEYGNATVATQPGWVRPTLYVYPDGSQIPETVEEDVFCVFEVNPDYGYKGRPQKWVKALTPFIEAQPMLPFFLSFALLPILSKKLQSPLLSPALEIVGEPQCGKSTVLHLMGSVYGGNPASDVGLARSANFTKHSFKPLQRLTNDGLLLLDETNIVDKAVTESLSLVFELTATDERIRHGATQRKEQVRNAVVLTGNTALEEHGKADPAVLAAARTRIITFKMKGPLFSVFPEGLDSNQSACKALKQHCNAVYGTASRKFVKNLIELSENPTALSAKIETLMQTFRERVVDAGDAEGRLLDVFALTYAAGQLASDWKVFSKRWPDPLATTLLVFNALYGKNGEITLGQKSSPATKKLVGIIAAEKARIVRLESSKSGKTNRAVRGALGYYKRGKDGSIWIFFDPKHTQKSGMDLKLFKALRDEGILIGENGVSPKLRSKAPEYLPLDGRIYKIVLPVDEMPRELLVRKRRKKVRKTRSG